MSKTYLVLVRSSGYVTDSATDAAATDMRYFLAMESLSDRMTLSLEMSSSAYSLFFLGLLGSSPESWNKDTNDIKHSNDVARELLTFVSVIFMPWKKLSASEEARKELLFRHQSLPFQNIPMQNIFFT